MASQRCDAQRRERPRIALVEQQKPMTMPTIPGAVIKYPPMTSASYGMRSTPVARSAALTIGNTDTDRRASARGRSSTQPSSGSRHTNRVSADNSARQGRLHRPPAARASRINRPTRCRPHAKAAALQAAEPTAPNGNDSELGPAITAANQRQRRLDRMQPEPRGGATPKCGKRGRSSSATNIDAGSSMAFSES